jgi:hypothetical protein
MKIAVIILSGILLIIATLFISSQINGCHKTDTVQRDSTDQKVIDSLKREIKDVRDSLNTEKAYGLELEYSLKTLEAVYKQKRKTNSVQTSEQRYNSIKERIKKGLNK